VINGYLLASKEMILTNGAIAVLNNRCMSVRSDSNGLFAKLASSAATRMYNFACGSMKLLVGNVGS
jgi:hypothetical protein